MRSLTTTSVDMLSAAALALAVMVDCWRNGFDTPVLICGLLMAATVSLRRRASATAVLVAGTAATVAAHTTTRRIAIAPIALALDYYSAGRRSAERGWTWLDVALLALPIPPIAVDPATPSHGNPLFVDVAFVWLFFFVAPFFAGRTIGVRSAMNTALSEAAEQLESEQRVQARRLVVEERNRIARELHDVVAHSVSVMVIQTVAARRVAPSDTRAAAAALEAVESCGRDALADLRGMIGVVHRGDLAVNGSAAPGVSQLTTLADRADAAGVRVDIEVEGDERPLSEGLDLLVFRIVQEALTNAIKHSGASRAVVRLVFSPASLNVDVSDSGPGAAHNGHALGEGGRGLIGMQERLALYGGRLRAGPRRSGGFRVVAEVPLDRTVLR